MSLLRNIYYEIKPYVPFGARLAFRRALARRVLARSRGEWPVLAGSDRQPARWPGWPAQKKFALVLTHDVEGQKGVDNVPKLARLEETIGVRSSFNFVPEGGYHTPAELRADLASRGFEVGVHDLRHDGKLYRSQQTFQQAAVRINRYLHDWNVGGFRSGFMHHNLDWLHNLDIAYDMSTFDVDPFEPQPDGVGTIFPFWVPNPAFRAGHAGSGVSPGYVEMPYTLAQDSTLFLLLEEKTPAVWKEKLDWVAERGGMALVNVHPDYMAFEGSPQLGEYPAEIYAEFLRYVQRSYAGLFWLALPWEVAALVRENMAPEETRKALPEARNKLPLAV